MVSPPRPASGGGAQRSWRAASRSPRGSLADAGDAPVAAGGQALLVTSVALPGASMRTEGDEPGSGGTAGDGPPAFGAPAFRALLHSHRTAFTRPCPCGCRTHRTPRLPVT